MIRWLQADRATQKGSHMVKAYDTTCPVCGSNDIYTIKSDPSKLRCLECGAAFDINEAEGDHAPESMKLFLSYGHRDEEIVIRIKERLEARGHEVWFDRHEIKAGDEWRDEIARGVMSSNGVIAFLSKYAGRPGGSVSTRLE